VGHKQSFSSKKQFIDALMNVDMDRESAKYYANEYPKREWKDVYNWAYNEWRDQDRTAY
jgi:hypothetical protein